MISYYFYSFITNFYFDFFLKFFYILIYLFRSCFSFFSSILELFSMIFGKFLFLACGATYLY